MSSASDIAAFPRLGTEMGIEAPENEVAAPYNNCQVLSLPPALPPQALHEVKQQQFLLRQQLREKCEQLEVCLQRQHNIAHQLNESPEDQMLQRSREEADKEEPEIQAEVARLYQALADLENVLNPQVGALQPHAEALN